MCIFLRGQRKRLRRDCASAFVRAIVGHIKRAVHASRFTPKPTVTSRLDVFFARARWCSSTGWRRGRRSSHDRCGLALAALPPNSHPAVARPHNHAVGRASVTLGMSGLLLLAGGGAAAGMGLAQGTDAAARPSQLGHPAHAAQYARRVVGSCTRGKKLTSGRAAASARTASAITALDASQRQRGRARRAPHGDNLRLHSRAQPPAARAVAGDGRQWAGRPEHGRECGRCAHLEGAAGTREAEGARGQGGAAEPYSRCHSCTLRATLPSRRVHIASLQPPARRTDFAPLSRFLLFARRPQRAPAAIFLYSSTGSCRR